LNTENQLHQHQDKSRGKFMNYWTQLSIDFAGQRNYLDQLFTVYPTIPEGIRSINENLWEQVENSFDKKDNEELLKALLKFDLFPIKDSYIAYLKRDKTSIERNPNTVARLCGRLYEMGLDIIYARCSEPKETNRQIGPLFRRWLKKGSLGVQPVSYDKFLSNNENAVLDAGDNLLMSFAREHLNYTHDKGLDFIARFNKKYIIGEAKFLTDFGGHQNAQFNDAVSTLKTDVNAVTVAVLDGVLFIKGNNKMYRKITTELQDYNVMSALVLRDFLYQV
jgi:hypothetical protein